jgi:predicted dehydrogenase
MSGVRLGLIGAGRWGARYVATLRALPGVVLARVASGNRATAALVPPGCALDADWQALCRDSTLEGVIVATPPALHAPMALAAMRAGKAVLIEKPLTLEAEEARALRAMAERRNALVLVDHTHLYSAAYRELKRRAASLGRLQRIESEGGNRGPVRPGVSALWDYGPHDLAMALDLAGAPLASLKARREGQEPDGGEAVALELAFANGVEAAVRVSNIETERRRRFTAVCERGTLVYDDLASAKLVLRAGGIETPIVLDASMPLTNAVLAFRDAIVEGRRSDPGLALGVRVVELLEQCSAALAAEPMR